MLVQPDTGAQFIKLEDGRVSWWTDEIEFLGTYSIQITCQELAQTSPQVIELTVIQGRHLGNACQRCIP